MQYKIVGSTEADILGGKISNESPVGVALIGAKAGQTVDVETPKELYCNMRSLIFKNNRCIQRSLKYRNNRFCIIA